jgi:hypothetical protein
MAWPKIRKEKIISVGKYETPATCCSCMQTLGRVVRESKKNIQHNTNHNAMINY